MLNSLEIFNQHFSVLKYIDSRFIMPYNETHSAFQKRSKTIKVLNKMFEQHYEQLKVATEIDIEREHFPINVEISFKDVFQKSEMTEFVIYDKNKTYFGLQQVWFRRHILKLIAEDCYDYTYPLYIQNSIDEFLQNQKFLKDEKHFTKKFETVKKFDFFLKDLAILYRDNLENINKAMFE